MTARADEHLQVRELAVRCGVARTEVPLDHYEHTAHSARGAASAQNAERVLVVPVVEDGLEHAGVRASGQNVETARAEELATIDHSGSTQHLTAFGDDLRQVEQDAAHRRPACQHGGEQRAASTTDIHDRGVSSEVVCVQYLRARASGEINHRSVENRPVPRMVGPILPPRAAKNLLEGELAGA